MDLPSDGTTTSVVEDVNAAQSAVDYNFVFVNQESFEKYNPTTGAALGWIQGYVAWS